MLGRARAEFGLGEPALAVATLDELKARWPDYRSPEGHLLYAKALEGAGRDEEALAAYEAVGAYYPGAEPRVRRPSFWRGSAEATKRARSPTRSRGACGARRRTCAGRRANGSPPPRSWRGAERRKEPRRGEWRCRWSTACGAPEGNFSHRFRRAVRARRRAVPRLGHRRRRAGTGGRGRVQGRAGALPPLCVARLPVGPPHADLPQAERAGANRRPVGRQLAAGR